MIPRINFKTRASFFFILSSASVAKEMQPEEASYRSFSWSNNPHKDLKKEGRFFIKYSVLLSNYRFIVWWNWVLGIWDWINAKRDPS